VLHWQRGRLLLKLLLPLLALRDQLLQQQVHAALQCICSWHAG
jgi:hypothetical protein